MRAGLFHGGRAKHRGRESGHLFATTTGPYLSYRLKNRPCMTWTDGRKNSHVHWEDIGFKHPSRPGPREEVGWKCLGCRAM